MTTADLKPQARPDRCPGCGMGALNSPDTVTPYTIEFQCGQEYFEMDGKWYPNTSIRECSRAFAAAVLLRQEVERLRELLFDAYGQFALENTDGTLSDGFRSTLEDIRNELGIPECVTRDELSKMAGG